MEKIDRYYLEITSIKNLKGKDKPSNKTILELVDNKNYEFNEFFYKQIGKKHHWGDRLVWKEKGVLADRTIPILDPSKDQTYRDLLQNSINLDLLAEVLEPLCLSDGKSALKLCGELGFVEVSK